MSRKNFAFPVLKILALTVILMLINALALQFLPASAGSGETPETTPAAPPPGSFLALVFAIMLLQTIAIAYPTARSKWSGWRLALAVFVLYFGTVTFMSQIESLVYLGGKMPEGLLGGLFAMGAFAAALFAPIAVLVLGKWRPGADASAEAHRYEPRTAAEWTWKTAVGGFVFLAFYYLFGYYVAWRVPEVRDYYGGTDPGSFSAQMQGILENLPWMVAFQYLRGLMWTGLAILVIRIMKGPWWEAGLATAILFSVPSFYLLMPNELMPEAVRIAHFVETLPYQFLFGWFAAWLFCRFGAGKTAIGVAGA